MHLEACSIHSSDIVLSQQFNACPWQNQAVTRVCSSSPIRLAYGKAATDLPTTENWGIPEVQNRKKTQNNPFSYNLLQMEFQGLLPFTRKENPSLKIKAGK